MGLKHPQTGSFSKKPNSNGNEVYDNKNSLRKLFLIILFI